MLTIARRQWYLMVGLAAAAGAAAPAAVAYERPGITENVSVASDGTQANSQSVFSDLSSDGRFVAFVSLADNLVPEDNNGQLGGGNGSTEFGDDVFVRDRKAQTTELVSLAPDGTQLSEAWLPRLSADGRYVAFYARVCSEDRSVCDPWRVFVRDRAMGTTELVSVASDGAVADGDAHLAFISADGRFVAFSSLATNLVAGDTNENEDVFVRDRETGSTERVSVASDGSQGQVAQGRARCMPAGISGDGRVVAFDCSYPNLVAGDTNNALDGFVHDRQTGITQRVSLRSDGTELPSGAYKPSTSERLSEDGRFVAFGATGPMSTTFGSSTWQASYVHDRATGTTERVSVHADGAEMFFSGAETISGDGRYVAFICSPYPFTALSYFGVLAQVWAVCLHDRAAGTTEYMSPVPDDALANTIGQAEGNSPIQANPPAISPDGRYVAWTGGEQAAEDTNNRQDVLIRDRGPAAGIGGLTVQQDAGQHQVTGWATFSGATVALAEDSPADGDDAAGAEITTASVTHRPETEDLLIRIDVASLPVTEVPQSQTEAALCPGGTVPDPGVGFPPKDVDKGVLGENCLEESYAGAAGTLYRLRFHFAQSAYEVRVLPADPTTPARAALYECTPACSETAALAGAVGTTGPQARVSLPLDVLGIDETADVTQIQASVTKPGESAPADTLVLSDAHIEPPQVKFGVAPPKTPEGQVPLTTNAALADGLFSATLDTTGLVGPQQLLARGCLEDGCGFDAFDLGAFEAAPTNRSLPLIDGEPAVGSLLTCSPGEWSAYPAPTFAYQWLRDGAAITGATGGTYPLIDADAAATIACRVTATNSRGSAQVTSAPVSVPAVPPASGSAVVEGSAAVGAVLTCAPSGFGGAPSPSYGYQWRRDGQPIPGATADTYTVTRDDAGRTITCLVTATNPGGSAGATSPARSIPALSGATPNPTGTPTDTPAATLDAPTARGGPVAGDAPGERGAPLQVQVRPRILRHRQLRKLRTLRLQLVSSEPLTRITASLTKGKRKYGRGRLARMGRSRMLTVRLTRPLRRGTYRLRVAARQPGGSTARLAVRLVVR